MLRQVAWAKTFGLPLELISAEQARELFPLMSTEGVRCASYLPSDGYLDPSLLTYRARRRRARGRLPGVHAHPRDGHRRRRTAGPRVRGVQTEWGPIEAEVVVNAGGMFAAEIGRHGRRARADRARSRTSTSSRSRSASATRGEHLPTLRDPDLLIYFREEGGGLVMGGYERDSAPWALDEHLLDAIPPTSTGGCSRRTGRASRRSPPTRAGACR